MSSGEVTAVVSARPAARSRCGVLLFCGACFLIWAFWGYRIPTQSLRWTASVAGFGLILWGLAQGTRWQQAGGWTALALVGQACSLQLLEVGSQINRLQLFYGWEKLLGTYRAIFLGVLLLQAAIVIVGSRRLWPTARRLLPEILSGPQGVTLLVLLGFAAVTISPSVAQALLYGGLLGKLASYATKVALGFAVFGTGLVSLLLAARSIPAEAWEKVVARWQHADRRQLPWFCALWVLLISSLIAWFVLDRLPHVPDEIAYLFHAKYFAAGHLYLPPPPDPQAFSCSLTWIHNGKWYSAHLPGWPLVLAAGVRMGVPWLINPILGALAVLLAHSLVRRLYGRAVADGTALLLAGSPWLLFMSATLLGHPLSLALTLAALLGVQRARESGGLWGAALAGCSLGGLANTRPLEALAIGVVAGLWWLSAGWTRIRILAITTATLAGLIGVALQLAYNQALTGDPLVLPFEKMVDQASYAGGNRLGFGSDVGNFGWTHLDPLPGHGPLDVMINTNQNLYIENFELFGWACGSLLFVFLLLVWRAWRRDALMWGSLFAIWLAMSFYWFSGGPDFGARYWYQMIVPLAVLTVRGAQELAARWAQLKDAIPGPQPASRVWAFVMVASLLSCLNVLPWRALDKYKNYRGVRADVRRLEREHRFGRSLVFVRGEAIDQPWASSPFASAFALNPPTFDRDVRGPIYVRDLGAESRERVRSYYPDRPAWVIDSPAQTGSGFRLAEGPLPPVPD